MKRLISFFVLFTISIACHSQTKQIINQQLYWMRYYNQLSLSKQWSWHNEFEERRFFINNRHHHFIFHSRFHYKISKSSEVAFGFTYSLQDPQDPWATTKLTIPELRPVQEYTYTNWISNRFSLSQRLRLDERYIHKNDGQKLINGYNFNLRIRHRIQANFILNKNLHSKPTVLKIADELMINAGDNIVYNSFDQNRIYAGIEIPINRSYSAELGYMYWFQQKSNGFQYYDRDIFRFTLYHKSSRKHN